MWDGDGAQIWKMSTKKNLLPPRRQNKANKNLLFILTSTQTAHSMTTHGWRSTICKCTAWYCVCVSLRCSCWRDRGAWEWCVGQMSDSVTQSDSAEHTKDNRGLLLQFLVDPFVSSRLQVLVWESKAGNEASKGRETLERRIQRQTQDAEGRFMTHCVLCNEIDFLIPLMWGWQQRGGSEGRTVSMREDVSATSL